MLKVGSKVTFVKDEEIRNSVQEGLQSEYGTIDFDKPYTVAETSVYPKRFLPTGLNTIRLEEFGTDQGVVLFGETMFEEVQ